MTQDSPSRRPPNIVLVVLDDAGFAQLGCFGAELSTPRIDAIATTGLRFNSFHVTALCSPTRSCLLSGRNHHSVGMGLFPEIPIDRPGYSGRLPENLTTLPGTLRIAGYTTYAVGKWHLTPKWERSAAGPFTRWPLGMGFDRYYGFLGAESNQWSPTLVRDNGVIPAPQNVGDGYHLTEDLADQAVLMIRDHVQAVPQRPFFMYFATAAPHAPHHVGPQWSDRYHAGRGQRVGHGLGVIQGEWFWVAHVVLVVAGEDKNQVRADAIDLPGDRGLRAAPDGQHCNDRCHANHDAQYGQAGAELVGCQALKGFD
jgi:arylsulfatase